jgi:hypothetical protein
MSHKKLIFVSCGQLTDEEKQLGSAVKNLIDSTDDFEAYFAESVHDLDALACHVFEALNRCSGAISLLHGRGSITDSRGENRRIRSSVWINQEISILAFRQFLESTNLPILVFKETDVKLEGAMTSLIVNPLPLMGIDDALSRIEEWLKTAQFLPGLADEFEFKWSKLSLDTKKVINCLFYEGGYQVNELNIYRQMKQKYAFPDQAADAAVRNAILQFIDTGLVICEYKNASHEMTFHPTWKWYVVRAARSVDETNI